ncbi:MAG: tetraacyldisaccharide 4'-kinase, partial [Desulfobulbaceae bacterium]|nr:tetraacyldisaccharide 4'-kinase [Desulfobulbaceae bacterium]
IILDDGFQHMAVQRDLNLVLFHADTLAGNSRVFPGGDLREPIKALNRCDAFVLTYVCSRNRERAERFVALLHERFPDKPVFFSSQEVDGLVSRSPGSEFTHKSKMLTGKVFGFCAIGQPDSFRHTLMDLGLEVVGFKTYADHYAYKEEDINKITHQAMEKGASALVATEKDIVKLGYAGSDLPLYAIRSSVKIEAEFSTLISKVVEDRMA